MDFIKRNHLAELIFFAIIFAISIQPLVDYDVWFHLKSGEIISKLGIIHHDVFAYTTLGREWSPYEWLFQVAIFQFQQLFGLEAVKFFVAFFFTAGVLGLYFILRRIFKLNLLSGLILSFIFFTSVAEFIAPRPYIVAYPLFILTLLLILNYFFSPSSWKKTWLWLSLPITWVWANLHGSVFLDIALFGSYAGVALIHFLITKQKIWLTKFKILSLFTMVIAILTILPPLGLTQYRLLWTFFQNRELLAHFISEWAPVSADPWRFIAFTITTIATLILTIGIIWKKKLYQEALWILPLIPIILITYLATRNAYLSMLALIIIFGWSLKQISFRSLHSLIKVVSGVLVLVALSFSSWILWEKLQPVNYFYPQKAAEFIKNYHLSGHMFNEYGFGGYLLYILYPTQQVFIDGRTDLYLCCEIPDVLNLSLQKNLPSDQYQALLDSYWNKYDVSFVLFRTEKNTVLRKISTILTSDPKWSLVFWDDNTEIFVRHDGKNDPTLKQFGVLAATPYEQNPFKSTQKQTAQQEYLRMTQVADSSKSRNALGYIDLLDKKYPEAQAEFEKAVILDPNNESPLMNLAELAAANGDLNKAISLYQKAKDLAPDRGLIYIRLGQLTQENGGSLDQAKKIWQEGLVSTVDSEARSTLQKLLTTN